MKTLLRLLFPIVGFAFIFPPTTLAATASAVVYVSEYDRQEDWTHTCDMPTTNSTMSKLNSFLNIHDLLLSNLINSLAAVFKSNQPISQTTVTDCENSIGGGLKSASEHAHWGETSGGLLFQTDVATARYGGGTKRTVVSWNREPWPPTQHPSFISYSGPEEEYVSYSCDTKTDPFSLGCNFASYFGYFTDHVGEFGNGYGYQKVKLVTSYDLYRIMNYKIKTKTKLKAFTSDPTDQYLAVNVTLHAKAYEVKNYPDIRTATRRQLGSGEYTVAGKRVGTQAWNAYTISLQLKNNQVVDVTPVANFPLVFFDVGVDSFTEVNTKITSPKNSYY